MYIYNKQFLPTRAGFFNLKKYISPSLANKEKTLIHLPLLVLILKMIRRIKKVLINVVRADFTQVHVLTN